jgi:hypothetical protein
MLRRHRGGSRREAADAASPRAAVAGSSDLKDQFPYIYQCLEVPIKPSLRRAQSALGGRSRCSDWLVTADDVRHAVTETADERRRDPSAERSTSLLSHEI